MTPSDDLSPPRRPIFFPVVIATVFLTIIGMAAGFVLSERQRRSEAGQQQQQQQQEQQPAPAPETSDTPVEGLCPEETQAKARQLGHPDGLRRVLKLVTTRGTTVWICEDAEQRLYYQSKTGGEDTALIQGQNGLLLADVKRTGEDQYVAVAANGNTFSVSPKRLVVEFADGRPDQVDRVARVE